MKVDAVVLAGGDGAVIDPTARFKGMVPIAGKPMIEWVIDALRASETIAEIAVVVPTAEDLGPWADKVDKLVVSDQKFIDNCIAGVESFRNDRFVLVATGDLPALTPDAIDDYVSRSLASGAEITYPLVPADAMEAQFPGSQRTYVKIVGGPVTGGNIMVISPGIVRSSREIGQRFFDTRKNPAAMAQVIGVGFIIKLVTGRLKVADVERKLGTLLGGKCAAIYTDHASIGADIDKPIDVIVAERVLYQRSIG